jgi:hypothetical protein
LLKNVDINSDKAIEAYNNSILKGDKFVETDIKPRIIDDDYSNINEQRGNVEIRKSTLKKSLNLKKWGAPVFGSILTLILGIKVIYPNTNYINRIKEPKGIVDVEKSIPAKLDNIKRVKNSIDDSLNEDRLLKNGYNQNQEEVESIARKEPLREEYHQKQREIYLIIKNALKRRTSLNNTEINNWAEDISSMVIEEGFNPSKNNIAALLSQIERESSFHADPPVPNIKNIYNRGLREVKKKHPVLYKAVDKVGLVRKFKDKYEPKILSVRTEGQLENVLKEIEEDIRFLKYIPNKDFIISNIKDVISTIGCMQLNLNKALELAAEKGENLTKEEMRKKLYTREGGLKYGIRYLNKIVDVYGEKGEINKANANIIFAAYNSGIYSPRNASLQEQLNRIMGTHLIKDGDFLRYNKSGQPLQEKSNTEKVVINFVKRFNINLSEKDIREILLKEKTKEFDNSILVNKIREEYKRAFGIPKYAIIPESINKDKEQIKFGQNIGVKGYVAGSKARYDSYRMIIGT